MFANFSYVCLKRQQGSPSSIGQRTCGNDDCIILIVNAISRAEFDEFTTRFCEDTERMVRDRLPPPLFPSLSFSLSSPPGTLIYVRRYLCQWIYISIFIIRNIIARAFIALVEMPSPRRAVQFFPPPSFRSFFVFFFPARSLRGPSRSISQELVSVVSHLRKNIYYVKTRVERTRRIKKVDRHLSRIASSWRRI